MNQAIMVVEDDATTRERLVRLLEYAGCWVISAASMDEALIQLVLLPKLMLVDLDLPDESAAELLHEIRLMNKPIKVCVLTAERGDETRPELQVLNPHAFLAKPCHPDDVLHWVRESL